MRRWWKHTTEKTYEEMWSWELREELCGRDATIAEQAATIERLRGCAIKAVRLHQNIEGCELWESLEYFAITAADMGEAE